MLQNPPEPWMPSFRWEATLVSMQPSCHNSGHGAFSLIEILVAAAVFMLMAVLVVGMVDGTMRVTTKSKQRISADAGARQALDRMAEDFSHAVVRPDLPFRIEKANGNDSIAFLANAEGYTTGRGLSVIGYKVENNALLRGAEAKSWDGANPVAFTTLSNAAADPNYLTISSDDPDNYELAASDVFRLEIAFLTANGTTTNTVGTNSVISSSYVASMAAPLRAGGTNNIRAVIIGIAAMDRRDSERLTPDDKAKLISCFPDAGSGQDIDILTSWNGFLTNANMPAAARGSIRIYQRYIVLQ